MKRFTHEDLHEDELEALERILTSEEELQPMTGFSTRVMRAIKEDAAAPEPIVFPWKRFLPGFLLNLLLLSATGIWLILESAGTPTGPPIPTEWLNDPQMRGFALAALTVLGTGVMAWTVSRWAAPRSATLL